MVIQKGCIISPKIIKPAAGSEQNWIKPKVYEEANSSVKRPLTPPRGRKKAASAPQS